MQILLVCVFLFHVVFGSIKYNTNCKNIDAEYSFGIIGTKQLLNVSVGISCQFDKILICELVGGISCFEIFPINLRTW